jgi:hypothetical protein
MYKMDYKRDEAREFSAEIKREEKVAAEYKCRICGKGKESNLQCAHIYTLTKSDSWMRAGSDVRKISDDSYIRSLSNCLLLCKFHHERVDSVQGLKQCHVQYLESLKTSLTTCTALVNDKGGTRRCRNKNSRGKPGGSYRCRHHLNGGIEEKLPARTFVRSPKPKKTTQSEAGSSWCIIC